MGCNCEKNNSTNSFTVEVVDDTGSKYTGALYASVIDFVQWFTSSVAEFHIENNSKKALGESGKYSAHSLPMIGISKAEDDDEIKRLVINLKQGNTYAYLSSTGHTWKIGVQGSIVIEGHKINNVD